ncbi:hypothetical protein JCM19235_6376 [Vibrio maritimus]|uniref:Twin-arginine translocation protein TatB n=1 Tax=Vibrio maritimus TaxID=990268 RepID=A0A090RTC7_9VIBR|nr:hypothetical protein JCM19235_6376 [Vibrio maritimus]
MFDIGFWEMTMIVIVSLVVMGPQQMTKTVRSILNGITKMKELSGQVANQLNKELEAIETGIENDKK